MARDYFTGFCLAGFLSASGITSVSASGTLPIYRESLADPDDVEFFNEELSTCREGLDAHSANQVIPGYSCARRLPKLYSKDKKYELGRKCWHNGRKVPFPVFCRGDILQLRLDLDSSFPHGNMSSETAIEVNWGIASEAPFFCPKNVSNQSVVVPHKSYDYCLAHVCRQRLSFRSGPNDKTFGQFYHVNNTWILNLILRESPGHHVLAFRIFSCATNDCKLWKAGGGGIRSSCCSRGSNFDLTIAEIERNSVDRPATHIGNGQYNVTLRKSEAFIGVTVIDDVSGVTVQNISTSVGAEVLRVTLDRGVYQVAGSTDRGCSPGKLQRPVVLEPRNANYEPLVFLNLFERGLRWSLVSDIPIERFDFYSQKNASAVTQISSGHIGHTFALDGNEKGVLDDHAPQKQAFVHRVVYQGVSDEDNPTKIFPVDLSDFLPLNISVAHNNSHAFAHWTTPVAYPKHVVAYKLWVEDSKDYFVQMFDENKVGKVESFAYRPRELFVPGEVIIIGVGAVYQNNSGSGIHERSWFGPINSATIVISHSGVHSSSTVTSETVTSETATSSFVFTSIFTSSLTPSSTLKPTPGRDAAVGQIGVIAGASAVGGVTAVLCIVASVVTVCIYKLRVKANMRLLDDPVADIGPNEKVDDDFFVENKLGAVEH